MSQPKVEAAAQTLDGGVRRRFLDFPRSLTDARDAAPSGAEWARCGFVGHGLDSYPTSRASKLSSKAACISPGIASRHLVKASAMAALAALTVTLPDLISRPVV